MCSATPASVSAWGGPWVAPRRRLSADSRLSRRLRFQALEELPALWGLANPALQLIKALRADRTASVPATGGLHHLEPWVPDLVRAERSWGRLLELTLAPCFTCPRALGSSSSLAEESINDGRSRVGSLRAAGGMSG